VILQCGCELSFDMAQTSCHLFLSRLPRKTATADRRQTCSPRCKGLEHFGTRFVCVTKALDLTTLAGQDDHSGNFVR